MKQPGDLVLHRADDVAPDVDALRLAADRRVEQTPRLGRGRWRRGLSLPGRRAGDAPPRIVRLGVLDGTHTAGASPATGTVSIGQPSLGSTGTWPLPKGKYTAYYLLNDGYTAATSVDFTVQ